MKDRKHLTDFPELMLDWDQTINDDILPSALTVGSHKYVKWRCHKCGRVWSAPVNNRVNGTGCTCDAKERKVRKLRQRLVERDGSLADTRPEIAKQWHPTLNGDLTPNDITEHSMFKAWWIGEDGVPWQSVVAVRCRKEGGTNRPKYLAVPGVNDLRTIRPDLAKEWNYDKNDGLTPENVTANNNKKVWWRCRTCGNEWETLVSIRSGGSQCPYCSGIRLLAGFNDLGTTHPEIAAEWSAKNGSLRPENVNELSRRNVWWRCKTCGHEWQAVIYTRASGSRCPVCEGREVKPGYNDLRTTDPVLCREWDQELNGELLPCMVQRNSCKIVWWRSSCGHSWRGKIRDRVFHGQGCIKCDQAFKNILPYLMILYYAWEQGVQVIPNESSIIGVPLDFYFPEFKAAIIFSRQGQLSIEGTDTELVKDYLCERKGIRLIRVNESEFPESGLSHCICQKDDSDRALGEAIAEAFHYIGIHADIQIDRDRDILYECFRRMQVK